LFPKGYIYILQGEKPTVNGKFAKHNNGLAVGNERCQAASVLRLKANCHVDRQGCH